MTAKTEARKLPMMPIRDMVIFPYMMTPFVVGRLSSVRALEEALNGDRKIFLATQHDASIDEPKAKEIFQVGSICNIVQSVKMPDGNIKVLVEGVERAKTVEVNDRDGFFVATVRTGKTDFEMTPAVEQLMQRVTGLFEQYVKLQQSLNYETIIATVRMDEPAKLSTPSPQICNSALRRSRNFLVSSIPQHGSPALQMFSTLRLKSWTSIGTFSLASSDRWSARKRSTTSTKR